MPSYAITGTSRGLGLGFVRALSEDPENVVCAMARSPSTATELQDTVAANKHGNIHVVKADNDDATSLQFAAAEVSKVTGGVLDVLICNAALLHSKTGELPLHGFDNPDDLDADLSLYFKTNVLGPIHTINAFLPLLRGGKLKKCILISSTAASVPISAQEAHWNFPGYSISKAALNLATAKYAGRFKNEGIVFLSLAPGFVLTMPGTKEELMKRFEPFVSATRKIHPNFEGPISTEESVHDMLELIGRATLAESGAFLNRDGSDGNIRQ